MYVAYLLIALALICPASAMIKDSVYIGTDSVVFNTSMFFISQPNELQYFQSPYEGDLTQSDGYYYPVVMSFNPYPIGSGLNGTLNVYVEVIYPNLTSYFPVNENITFDSGVSYADNDDLIATGFIMPIDGTAIVTLTREEGNFTVLKRNVWYKQIVILNKPNLDAMSNALVDVVTWYLDLLRNVVTPILNFAIMLWNMLLQWLVAAEVLIFVIRRAVMLGSNFIPHNTGR
jgi:hypothetical protein